MAKVWVTDRVYLGRAGYNIKKLNRLYSLPNDSSEWFYYGNNFFVDYHLFMRSGTDIKWADQYIDVRTKRGSFFPIERGTLINAFWGFGTRYIGDRKVWWVLAEKDNRKMYSDGSWHQFNRYRLWVKRTKKKHFCVVILLEKKNIFY